MDALAGELARWSWVEIVAAVLALAYLLLAVRQSIWCWPCALVSTAIYLWLFVERALYQQAALQVLYIVMAVYGYWQWRPGGAQGAALAVSRRTWRWHAGAFAIVIALTALTGWLEARHTDAHLPYLDAFTTWGSVITTWMVTRKILENWLYWLIVDGVMVYLCIASGLPVTALLFVIYLGIVVAGFLAWRRDLMKSGRGRAVA